MFLASHALFSFPVSNPNRDRDGKPKGCIFGGVPRSRASSQSWNFAMRAELLRTIKEHCGIRTSKIRQLVEEEAKKIPEIKADAVAIAENVRQLFSKKENTERDREKGKTQMLLSSKMMRVNSRRLLPGSRRKTMRVMTSGLILSPC